MDKQFCPVLMELSSPEPSSCWSFFVASPLPLICREKPSPPASLPSFPCFCNHHKAMQALSSYRDFFFLRGNFVMCLIRGEAASPQLRLAVLKPFWESSLCLGILWDGAEIPAAIKMKLLLVSSPCWLPLPKYIPLLL